MAQSGPVADCQFLFDPNDKAANKPTGKRQASSAVSVTFEKCPENLPFLSLLRKYQIDALANMCAPISLMVYR